MYLVFGSQGLQGGAVARRLRAEGLDVRGFRRQTHGDLADAAAVRSAFAGVTHASVVLPLVYDMSLVETYTGNIIEAARAAGVRRIVFNTNTPLPAEDTGVASYETRRTAERMFVDSGLPVVVLRPTVYLENTSVTDRVLAYPLSVDRRVAWLSHADLAAATAAALHVPDLEGAVIPLGGPRAVTGPELAAELASALGREVTYVPVEVSRFEAGLARVLGPDAAAGVAGIYHWAALGREPGLFAPDHDAMARTLGIRFPGITTWAAGSS